MKSTQASKIYNHPKNRNRKKNCCTIACQEEEEEEEEEERKPMFFLDALLFNVIIPGMQPIT
jgi:hypothetical protein